MSRRTGKAATRRARQQKRIRQGPSPAPTTSAPAPAPALDAPVEGGTTAAAPRPAPAPRTSGPAYAAGSSSRLGESARLEYHYVRSDLRNTGILVVIMTGLLAAAVVIVNLVGSAPQ